MGASSSSAPPGPSCASSPPVSSRGGHSLLLVLVQGVHSPGSPLALLRPVARHILPAIVEYVWSAWKEAVFFDEVIPRRNMTDRPLEYDGLVSLSALCLTGPYLPNGADKHWPVPKQRNVNMMPFVCGNKNSLPADLHDYWDMIQSFRIPKSENGKVCYLTIQESTVKVGESQRRAGLHVESPGTPNIFDEQSPQRRMTSQVTVHPSYYGSYIQWGGGLFGTQTLEGGIYMASNVDQSTRIYHCQLRDPALIGHLGSLEHMRPFLDQNCPHIVELKAHERYWLTDLTPHESLPLKTGQQRSYIRIVTHEISVWYAEHSTPNPKCPLPVGIPIVLGSKFGPGGMESMK